MSDFLSHPLVLLFFCALLSGLLSPFSTRNWQDRAKSVEIKTELVSELSEATMEMLKAVQFVHLGSYSMTQKEFDPAYRTWEISKMVIGTKLHAYYPGTNIPDHWEEYAEIVTDFYALEGTPAEQCLKRRKQISSSLNKLFGIGEPIGDDWDEIRSSILDGKAELIQAVLDTKIRVLG